MRPYRIEVRTGLGFWFTPLCSNKTNPPHPQYLITLSAIFPLTLLPPKVVSVLFEALDIPSNMLLKSFIVAGIIVALMIPSVCSEGECAQQSIVRKCDANNGHFILHQNLRDMVAADIEHPRQPNDLTTKLA